LEDALFDGALDDEPIGGDGAGLADAVAAVDGLGFDGGVPPRVEEEDIARGGEVEAGAAGFEADQKHRSVGVVAEAGNAFGAVLGAAVEADPADLALSQSWLDQRQQRSELRKDEDLVPFGGELVEAFDQQVE